MKKLLSAVLSLLMVSSLAACNNATKTDEPVKQTPAIETAKTEETEKLVIGVPKAPPALPILYMMEHEVLGDNVDIELEIWSDPETLISMVQDGNHDIFAFPMTVISKLYNKGFEVSLMNVNTWGVTYFMSDDPSVTSFKDLKGKSIYCPLKSSPPDILTQYFIANAGLEVGTDVTINYGAPVEVGNILASGEGHYGTMIEPFATMVETKNKDMHRVCDFEEEWGKLHDGTMYPNAGLGAMNAFLKEDADLAKKFNDEYAKAVVYVNEHPDEIGALAEKYLGLKAPLITKAIPNMGLEYKSAMDSKQEADAFYQVLKDFDPKTIGGNIPDEAMYYDAK